MIQISQADASAAQREAIQAEQTKLLYAGLPNAIIVNALMAPLLAAVQYAAIPSRLVWAWLALISAVLLARTVLALAWRREGAMQPATSRWLSRFRILAAATGFAWGAGAILLFPPNDPVHQAFLALVLAGMSTGSLTLLAADRRAMFWFVTPTLLPLVARLWFEGGQIALVMGAMAALYLLFIPLNAARTARSLRENFALRLRAEEQQAALRESEARLKRAQRSAQVGNWELDIVHNKLYWSDEIYRMFEIDPAQFGASYEYFLNIIHPDDRERVNNAYTESLATRQRYDIVHRLLFADGRIKFVRETCETEFDAMGTPLRSMGTVQDITTQRAAEDTLRESEARFRFMLETSPIAARIARIKPGRVVFANQRYATLLSSAPDEVIGVNPEKYYANPREYTDLLQQVTRGERITNRLVELVIPNDERKTKWVLASYTLLEYEGQPSVLGWFYDITDRKEMEEKVQHLAYHDPLTDLPNRTLFTDRLQQALFAAKRGHEKLALLFIDLDRFKPINDTLGHHVGDLMLKDVAQRIRACLRESDTVARIGGDEFVVLLPSIKAEADAREVAEKIRETLNLPFRLAGHDGLRISSSTGIAVYPDHGSDEKQLMDRADTAMYEAKAAGRDRVRFSTPDASGA